MFVPAVKTPVFPLIVNQPQISYARIGMDTSNIDRWSRYIRFRIKMKQLIFVGILLVCMLIGGCSGKQDFDDRLNSIVRPYLFSITAWELIAIPNELGQWIFGNQPEIDDEISVVIEYFTNTHQIRALRPRIAAARADNDEANLKTLENESNRLQDRKTALESTVESIIEKQIRESLTELGIYNPLIRLRVSFPPINFTLEKPPHLLVVSPRDRIESVREITLQPDIDLEDRENIEAGGW